MSSCFVPDNKEQKLGRGSAPQHGIEKKDTVSDSGEPELVSA